MTSNFVIDYVQKDLTEYNIYGILYLQQKAVNSNYVKE